MQHRFVIVGYGTMGFTHTRNLTALGIEVAGIVDIDPVARDEAAEAGLHVYPDLDAACADDTADVLFICTPNEVHRPIALAGLAAGKHVVTEKPAMLGSAEIEEVMAAAEAADRRFIVHQNRRWDEDYLVMKEMFEARTIGEVTFIETRVDGSRGIPGDWRRDPERGGGMVLDWGVHLVDRLLLMVPAPVRTVYARLSYALGAPVEDGFTIYLTFANGVEALAACTTDNYAPRPKFHMTGRRGTATVDDWEMHGKVVRRVEDVEPDAKPIVAGKGMTKTMAPRIVDYGKLAKVQDNVEVLPLPRVESDINDFYRNVIAAIEGTAEPAVTTPSVLRCMRVLEAARRSHEQDVVVDLSGTDTYLAS
ncbi:Gfo/Idh/MocA family oxidoreductase [Actinotalea sp. M2MS4P-6]|uniref:Gfo/Idh/MocA family protein n=1 Tax=Actinotalea sp. M2MS4P-6 TaxID=2983762 RepID=UPI0021E479A4|nr:Gfo/Idh/MocA family oxidoreductase [Actinotalea sp. M2MS4P-6]MCV2394383.1 Gfo/Idh/MocA family oxidoreductase [Actinotalea sp. M2MS4P-6]